MFDEEAYVKQLEELERAVVEAKEEVHRREEQLEELRAEYLYEKSRTCPKCGARYVEGAKFCHVCGSPVHHEIQEGVVEDEEACCQSCGNPLKPGAKFCGICGKEV